MARAEFFDRDEAREIEPVSEHVREYRQVAWHHADEAELAIREAISFSRAGTFEGAAVQMLEILRRLDDIEMIAGPLLGTSIDRDVRAIHRLLYSSLAIVEAECTAAIADQVDATFAARYRNPWLSPNQREKALAASLSSSARRTA